MSQARLESQKLAFSIAAAMLLGAALLSVAFVPSGHPLTIALTVAAVGCMWGSYKKRLALESIKRRQ